MKALGFARALAFGLIAGGCAGPGTSTVPRSRPHGPEPAAVAAPPRLELVLVDAALSDEGAPRETVVRWTERSLVRADDGSPVSPPRETSEDHGLFAFAERRTALHLEPSREAEAVGHLAPGARVGVRDVKGAWARVILFAWRSDDSEEPASAWARVSDLGARARLDGPPPRSTDEDSPRVYGGHPLRTVSGRLMGRTFCGELDVLGELADGLRVTQTEEGVTLEGVVDRALVGRSAECRSLVLVDKKTSRLESGQVRTTTERLLRYHDRVRRHHGPAPAGLVATKPLGGPTFGVLLRARASVYWLVPDPEKVAVCAKWELSGAERSGEAKLVARNKLDDGDTIITTFGVRWTDEDQSVVTLLGPSSEVRGPPGRAPRRSGVSVACGQTLRVVASDGGALTVLRGEGGHGSNGRERVLAYDPRATERWYTEERRCEADAERARAAGAGRARVALGFSPSGGC